MHVALLKQPINQFKPVQWSRQKEIRACCPHIYILWQGVFYALNPLHAVVHLNVLGCKVGCTSIICYRNPGTYFNSNFMYELETLNCKIACNFNGPKNKLSLDLCIQTYTTKNAGYLQEV